jgi:hypothetical protein
LGGLFEFVHTPVQPGSTVAKGATVYGLGLYTLLEPAPAPAPVNPQPGADPAPAPAPAPAPQPRIRIIERVARRTYALEVPRPAKDNDPAELRFVQDGVQMTEGLVPWVNAGDKIAADHCITEYLQAFSVNQNELIYRVYSSEDRLIQLRTQPGVRKELDIVIDLPVDGTNDRIVETKIYFGDTHIRVQSKDIRSQEEKEYRLNFEAL